MFCQQCLCEFSSLPVIYRWTSLPRISCYSCSKDDWWWQHQPGTDSMRHFTRSCPYYRCCARYRGWLCCTCTTKLVRRHHIWNIYLWERGWEVVYVLHNQNNCDQKFNFSALGPQRLHIELPVRKKKISYSLIYIFCVILFPFWVGKKQAFINCSVSGNRKPGNSSWIYMRIWLGCQVWFNSRRPFRDGPAMSTRDEMKPPIIKAMHILFTVVLLSWNSPLFAPLSGKAVWELRVCDCFCVCVWQGYASTEESLGNCVLLISDMSDVARDNAFPSTAKLKAALRLLYTKQPTWVWALGRLYLCLCVCLGVMCPLCVCICLRWYVSLACAKLFD